jgi:L-threonylcarbamoyladenylate synthase
MTTIVLDPTAPDPAVIARAARLIRSGEPVAFPTETVYGLGANALDAAAVRRLFEAKGRPAHNPIIVHVESREAARQVVRDWPPIAERLACAFWPGPLTLVLPKRAEIPDEVTAGLPTVAVRVPAHPVALALLRAAAVPIAAPSANRSGEVSPTTARHVEKALGDRVSMILDAGPTQIGIESTVVDLSNTLPVVLRPGTISPLDLTAILGPVGTRTHERGGTTSRPAPGMLERHYAPRAALRLFDGADRAAVLEEMRQAANAGRRLGALLLTGHEDGTGETIHMPNDPSAYARALYAALHSLDDVGCELVLVERAPLSPEWAGVRDRLERAAKG